MESDSWTESDSEDCSISVARALLEPCREVTSIPEVLDTVHHGISPPRHLRWPFHSVSSPSDRTEKRRRA